MLLVLLLGIAGSAGSVHAASPLSAQAFIDSATSAMRSDPDESRRSALAALAVLKVRPDVDLQVQAHLLLCDYYSERDVQAAQIQASAAAALLADAARKGLRAGVLTCQGETAETQGDNTRAQALFDQAVAVASSTGDNRMLAEALFSRGFLRGLQGSYATGLADLRRSQELYEQLKMPIYALTVFNTVATIYNRMGDYEQAAQIYERGLQQQRAAGLLRDEAVTLHNLGLAHLRLGEADAARAGFSGCLALSRQLHYTRGQAYGLLGLAQVDNATGNPTMALDTLQGAQALQQQTPDAQLKARIDLAQGTALRQLSRWQDALAPLQQAADTFNQIHSPDDLATTYAELANAYSQLGNWRQAYEYRTQAQQTSEQLLRNQLDQRFASLKVEFDTATKEKENTLLLRENAINSRALAQARRTRALQTAIIVLAVMLLGVLTMLVLYQRRSAGRMRALAMTDELTGLPNRRSLLARLDALLRQGPPLPCSLLIIDIDHFKGINDRYGHPVGDETLRQFTARLRDTVREPAFLGRLGGEEFAVVLPATGLTDARRVAEQLRLQAPAVDLSRWLGEQRITVSIGVTTSTRGAILSHMLRCADAALYAAKYGGRNCVRTEPPGGANMAADADTSWRDTRIA